ncbi:hypothetical protein B0H13DRAFT_1862067 [Mycena leptocephala]|nr:hypothetical protein B0H13DRAFT_1862067 [Mycena leptocephala]
MVGRFPVSLLLEAQNCLLLEISKEPTGCSTFRLRLSRSPRSQETVSPKSDHTPCNDEGRSICIKAEKIVGDWGPKGMRDSKPAGSTSMLGGISTTAGTTEFRTLLTPADYSGWTSSSILCAMRTSGNLNWKYGRTSEGNLRVLVASILVSYVWVLRLVLSTQSLGMLPRLANRVAVPFFSPPAWPIPTERDPEIAEAEEQMAESLIHTEAAAQDTL